MHDRSCTDFFWAIIMGVTFFGMFGLATYALVAGQPAKFIAPYDAAGHMCGYENEDFKPFTKMYFTYMDFDVKNDENK